MPYPNARSLSSQEVPDFDPIAKKYYHLTSGPFGVVVSSLNSHQADHQFQSDNCSPFFLIQFINVIQMSLLSSNMQN